MSAPLSPAAVRTLRGIIRKLLKLRSAQLGSDSKTVTVAGLELSIVCEQLARRLNVEPAASEKTDALSNLVAVWSEAATEKRKTAKQMRRKNYGPVAAVLELEASAFELCAGQLLDEIKTTP